MADAIRAARSAGDSLGGVVACTVRNCPVGLGDPVFDKLEATLGHAMLSIPACKGFEVGSGFAAPQFRGSEHNDAFYMEGDRVRTRTNNSGGIQGGISNGMPILFTTAIKATPSIACPQESVNLSTMEAVTLEVSGRHDPCIVPRAVPVVEAAAAIAIYDLILGNTQTGRRK
jgi:chorismate synthase